MASSRRLAIYIFLMAATLTVAGIAVLSWTSPLIIDSLGINPVALDVTGIQFDIDCLNVIVRNVGVKTTTINLVVINQTSKIYTVPVNEPILSGEMISIHVAFKWTSGYTYQIKLETADDLDCNTISAIAQ
jgi:hypothetical protein